MVNGTDNWFSKLTERKTLFASVSIAAIVSTSAGLIWHASNLVAKLHNVAETVETYKSETERDIETVLETIRDEEIVDREIAADIADIRERIATLEAQGEANTRVLNSATAAQVERDFIPVITQAPPDRGIGGPGSEPVPGLETASILIPYPQNIEARQAAVENLKAAHRNLLLSFSSSGFDDEKHDFEITGRQVLNPDNGSILLELTSTPVLRGVTPE